MAPLVEHLAAWGTGGGPALTILAFIVLLLIINLLNLCTTCQKHSFELEHEGGRVERSSSTLVRVVKLEDALTARDNPTANDIKKDEQELSSVPESEEPANGDAYVPWRAHTASQENALPIAGKEDNEDAPATMASGTGDMGN